MIDNCNEATTANNSDWFTSKPNDGSLDTTNSEEAEKATTGSDKIERKMCSLMSAMRLAT